MPQIAYQNTTLSQARAALAEKLGDVSMNFWCSDEIDGLLRESISTWNVAALYHRCRSGFLTTPGQAFYDISTVLADSDGLVLPRTLTTAQIAKSIVYHLIENNGAPADGTATSTAMFSIDDINQAIARRVNRFLEETGQIVTRITLPVNAGEGRQIIPNDWIDVRRAGWITPENAHTALWRVSEYILDSQFNDWNINPTNVPSAYSVAVAPILWLQVAPPPNDIGTLELLIVDSSNSINVFNDFGWVIKFGAMVDLLGQEGEARDAERSAYCQQRWDEGIQLAKIMTTVLRVMINGQAVQPCDVFDLDAQVPNWQDSLTVATAATARITETANNPIDGTAVFLGGSVFVWVNTVINPTDVKIGATVAESYQNMATAITADPEGIDLCTAVLSGSTITLTANMKNSAGNSITLTINDPSYGIITAFSGGTDPVNDNATPNAPAFASANLMALYPVPDVTVSVPDGRHSIVVDTIRNAILPIADNDFIQVGPEFYQVILQYAYHIGTFKCQGVEWQASFAGYKAAFQAAADENQRLKANAQNFVVLSAQEEIDRPRKRAA